MIRLENITFAYEPEEMPVFEAWNLQIEQGSFVTVEGDNGCGKTTLFRILNGLSFPQEGRYLFDGIEITKKYLSSNKHANQFHKRIGYLFQNPDIMLFNARVYDEIAFGPRQMGLSDTEAEQRTRDCMELFQLEQLADKAPYHLSQGQKKRVALAAVMALNPEILILDEPYAGLDKKTQQWLTDFLTALKLAGKTLILATHNHEAVHKLTDTVVMLENKNS